jgi:hypothetical protein
MLHKILPNEDWTSADARWPYVAMAICALALIFAAQDHSPTCRQQVFSTARQIELSLPSDPHLMEIMYERLGVAEGMCQRGQPQQAMRMLETLNPAGQGI